MHKNKVVVLLKSLVPEELRQLDKFVRSPIHNQHEEVIRLFQYLRKHLHQQEKALDKEKVFRSLFPADEFDMQKIHYLSSYLLRVAEEFIAWKEWRSNNVAFGLHLMKSYNSHRLEHFHKTSLIWTQEQHKTQPLRDAQYYHQSYQLYTQEYLAAKAMGRSKDFDLQQLIDTQDIAYIIEKLKNGCNAISHSTVNSANYSIGLLEAVLKFLEGHHYFEIPAVAIYYHAYMALSDTSKEGSFRQLKQLLTTHATDFQLSELRDLYILAANYCIRQLNSSKQGYLRELFEIYLSGFEIDVFLENKEISPWTYSNFIITGLRLGEYDKVEQFINQYKYALPEKQREGLFNYNYAFLHYEKQDYQRAMILLSTTDYGKDLFTTCAAKTLLARMYYEQEETETLLNLLQSFKVFIGRKELLGYHKDSYGNFISVLHKLISLRNAKRPNGEEILADLAKLKVVAAKDWLTEQAKAL